MVEPTRRYWFRAKRYGWGWGLPLTWQGWVFFAVWLATTIVGAVRLRASLGLYALFIVVMLGIMFAVCYAKGEPPRWRWGDRHRR
jgi:hypothetical protein